MLNQDIISVFKNFNEHTDDYLGAMYMSIFNNLPQCYRFFYDGKDEDKLKYIDTIECLDNYRKTIKKKIDSRKLLSNLIEHKDEFGLEIFCYSQYEYIVLGIKDSPHTFLMNIVLNDSSEISNMYEEIFCQAESIDYIFEHIFKETIVPIIKQKKTEFGITSIDCANQLYTSWYEYKNYDLDITKNYNDDFQVFYNKLCECIETENKSNFFLLYGEPGTGKTTLIKHLISKYKDKEFIFIDGSLLANTSKEKLMAYFLENQDTIFILEDCEKALVSRDKEINPVIPVLLNITDGIIGDVLGIKLICTFNTDLRNIDKALLRKGRLSIKYEFKKLSNYKASALLNRPVTEDMSLADIYYDKEENDFSKNNQKKIGF